MPKGKWLKPSKEELEHMIFTLNLKPKEIAAKLGYINGESNIYRYCREYGLKFNNYPNAHLREIDFSPEQKSIVVGAVLGDGYLRPSLHGYALSMTHSEKQLEYLEWKKDKLSPFVVTDKPSIRVTTPNKTFATTHLYSYNTIFHPFITEVRHLAYPDGVKTVTRPLLDLVDENALAVWFMDDGSLNKRYGTMSISTNSFTYDENELIQSWFNEKFDIVTKIEKQVQRSGRITYSIRINAKPARGLRELLSPYIPSCMRYKVDFH